MRSSLPWLALFVFCGTGFAASARNIVELGNTYLHLDFCSEKKDICRTVRVILPDNYTTENAVYPSFYMIADSGGARGWQTEQVTRQLLKARITPPIILVEIEPAEVSTAPVAAGRQAEFVARELVPYIDSNFRTLHSSDNRIIAAAGEDCKTALAILRSYDSFSRGALFSPLVPQTDVKKTGFNDPRLKLWLDASPADGSEPGPNFLTEPVARLTAFAAALNNSPFLYGHNYLTALRETALFAPGEKAARLKDALTFLSDGPGFEPVSVSGRVSGRKAGLNRVPENILFSLKTRYRNGITADRIPRENEIRVSPPYFGYRNGLLTLRYGAAPGPVTVTGRLGKLTGSAKVSVVKKAADSFMVTFTVTAPKDTPENAKIYLSGNSALLGGGKPDGIALTPGKTGSRHYRFSRRFPAGTALRFNFTLGDCDTAEKDSRGNFLPPRQLLVTADASINFRPAAWLSSDQIKSRNLAKKIQLKVLSPAKAAGMIAGPIKYRTDPAKYTHLQKIFPKPPPTAVSTHTVSDTAPAADTKPDTQAAVAAAQNK
ncbi:MAG: alpha/beta hydrolase-fold protein [Elusimicrobiaceae bacterium]|nr:alpha/beta hydrolase-fold protein [Elusimicrobiaceae bacterium]